MGKVWGDAGTDQPAGRDDDGDERKACGGRDPDGNGGIPAATTSEGAAEETRGHALDVAPCPHGHIGCRCPPDRYIFFGEKNKNRMCRRSNSSSNSNVQRRGGSLAELLGERPLRRRKYFFFEGSFFPFIWGFDPGLLVADAV